MRVFKEAVKSENTVKIRCRKVQIELDKLRSDNSTVEV